MLPYIIFAAAIASPTAQEIIQILRNAETIQTTKDAVVKNDFHENEFLPAVEKMIFLLSKGTCQDCLTEYLKALSFKIGSSDETITDQLGQIIKLHSKALNQACSSTAKDSLEKLKPTFHWSIKNLAYNENKKESEMNLKIPQCLGTSNFKGQKYNAICPNQIK